MDRPSISIGEYLADLRKNITRSFDEEDLRTLCFDLKVDYDDLPGRGKSGKVRDLVALMERIGHLDKLVQSCRELRPNVLWEDLRGTLVVSTVRKLSSQPLPFEPKMVRIPAGPFLMGSDREFDPDALDDEAPLFSFHLPDYYLAKTPITNAQYAYFVKDTHYDLPGHWKGGEFPLGHDDHPVVNVSWHDAVAYCKWLSDKTGRAYRLPSEAEWEKGARGDHGIIYCWGNKWSEGKCNSLEAGIKRTTPVGHYPAGASPYGLMDMLGNVWEWTRSLWGEREREPDFRYQYDFTDGREDANAPESVRRVLRGGSRFYRRQFARCAARRGGTPTERRSEIGFRVAISESESM